MLMALSTIVTSSSPSTGADLPRPSARAGRGLRRIAQRAEVLRQEQQLRHGPLVLQPRAAFGIGKGRKDMGEMMGVMHIYIYI